MKCYISTDYMNASIAFLQAYSSNFTVILLSWWSAVIKINNDDEVDNQCYSCYYLREYEDAEGSACVANFFQM